MRGTRRSGWERALLLLLGMAGCAAAAMAQTADCTSCHDQGQKVSKSAHAAVACATCHVKHEAFPHPEGIPKPACTSCHTSQATDYQKGVHGQAVKKGNAGAPDCALCHGAAHELASPKSQAFRTAVPDTCGMCHSDVVAQFRSSVHGQALAKGAPQAPICTDCHGEHAILAPTNAYSTVAAGHIRETCGNCHGNVRLSRRFGMPADRLVTFDASFHGLAVKSGNQTVANCASCHGVHNILPSEDARSTINPKNLAQTCGRCHQGAGKSFAISQVHVVAGRAEPAAVRWTRQFYLVIIPLTIGLMLMHNLGDWARKLVHLRFGRAIRHRFETDEYMPEARMLGFERVQHIVLVISFMTLVWTGFALKYPDQWWARPLLAWEGAVPLRGLVHRIAAGVFIGVSVTHLLSLIFNRRLREHWQELWPKRSDAAEALANFSYNVGIRFHPPGRSAHSYIEKAEYWAVVWGAIIMGLSGCVLWANNLMLRLLPKVWLDVATTVHFYEAVLATLAIVVWHFYTVIFDPDVYPMDTAWYSGISVKKHEVAPARQRPPAEAATTTLEL
jgi:cytochrome b subunit of formate dehydrogenase